METLQDAGWVTPPSPNGGVLLGSGLTALASAGGRPAQLVILHPYLVKLSADLNETGTRARGPRWAGQLGAGFLAALGAPGSVQAKATRAV